MSDHTDNGAPDRVGGPGDQPYEVADFAEKHAITLDVARQIIDEFGPSRKACDDAIADMA